METDIVTIDGPTSSGKNSVGFLLAKKLGYQYIDTGMIYRVGTILILKSNTPLNDTLQITNIFRDLEIEIKSADDGLRIFNKGEDLTNQLHLPEVSNIVPTIAAIKEVREITKSIQIKLGSSKNTVMTGRDIGSEIFPQAKHKFFLTASIEARANRRFEQLKKTNPGISFQDVLRSMQERDQKDSTRKVSPLRIPENAAVIDNSNLNIDQTVEKMLEVIKGQNASA